MARLKEFNPDERLEKAKQLFWAKGYHATSMKDIVKVMKLNPGSIYNTFGSKEALFMKCLEKYIAEKLADFREGASADGTPLEILKKVIREGAGALIREGKGCMTVKTVLELDRKNKEVHTLITRQAKSIIAIFETLLLKAKEAGDIPPHKDPREMAMFLYAGFVGVWQIDTLLHDRQYVDSIINQLIHSLQY